MPLGSGTHLEGPLRQYLGLGVLYFNTFFLVLGSYCSYSYLKSIYFFSRVYSKAKIWLKFPNLAVPLIYPEILQPFFREPPNGYPVFAESPIEGPY